MKHIYLLCLAIFACTISFSQEQIKLVSSQGSWPNRSSWDLDRLPQDKDVIIIPSNTNLTIATDVKLTDVQVRVFGTVTFAENNSQVSLLGNSEVIVYDGGRIQGDLSSQKLRLASHTVFSGNNPPVIGPAIATTTFPSFSLVTLPVKFAGFSLTRRNSDVLVQWSTTEEVAARSFEVERSTDGNTWNRVATVAARGSSSSLTHYTFTDQQVAAPVAYYRIRQVDWNGQFLYTAIKTIKNTSAPAEISIAAIHNRVVLQFATQVKGAVEVRLVSLAGQVVNRQVIHQPMGQVVLPPASVTGAYIVSVSNAADLQVARQVIL
ncbi:MAG TPA: hypothetical protein VGE66_17945 [Chitinophagaceae bacterium]